MTDQNADPSVPLIDNDSLSHEAGLLSVDPATRTVRGLLVPWGESSRTPSTGNAPLFFERGGVEVPADLAPLSVNRNHDRHDPVANFVSIEDTEAGLLAEFKVASNPAGDEFLAQYKDGTLRKLSAEITRIARDARGVCTALLTGAAFVTDGAFEKAALLSVDEPEEENHLTREEALKSLIEANQAALTAALQAFREHAQTTEDTESTEPETPTNTEKEEDTNMANATVPTSLANESGNTKEEATLSGVFNLLARAKGDDEAALLALSDIKHSGSGALPAAGVLQPAWLGQLWQGRTYTRKYMPLIRNGVIRSIDEKGFTLDQGTALVQPWAGNKAAIPSGTASTAIVSSVLQKWAYGADVAREFYDLPGGEEVMDAFMRGLAESYAKVTDEWTLAQIIASVGTTQAAATYPSGYSAVFGQLIQGAEAVEDAGDTPTFAILNQKAWDLFKYTPFEQVPEFLKFTFNIGSDASGATVPKIVKGATGIVNTPSVIVGSSNAAHVNERAGESPLNLDALDIAKGGIDKAVIGYSQFLADRPASLVRIGTADA
jgi:hypothetical protein